MSKSTLQCKGSPRITIVLGHGTIPSLFKEGELCLCLKSMHSARRSTSYLSCYSNELIWGEGRGGEGWLVEGEGGCCQPMSWDLVVQRQAEQTKPTTPAGQLQTFTVFNLAPDCVCDLRDHRPVRSPRWNPFTAAFVI